MVLGSVRCRVLDTVAADGAAAAAVDAAAVDDGLITPRGFLGQGSGVCAGGLAFDVWAAMASAAVGSLRGVGLFGVCAPSISASVKTRFCDGGGAMYG